MPQTSAHAHKLVAQTATQMAHEVYDELMRRNDWYALWKEGHPGASAKGLEELWVRRHWGDFVEGARATLAAALAGPLPEHLKEEISEALILDNTLIRGRANPSKVLGQI